MTRADTRTLFVAGATGLGVFFVGAWLWPAYDVQMVGVAVVATCCVIGIRSHKQGWRRWAEDAVGATLFYGFLYFIWKSIEHSIPK